MKMKPLMICITLAEGLQVIMFAFGAVAIQEAFQPAVMMLKLALSALVGIVMSVLVVFMYFKMFLDTSKQQ